MYDTILIATDGSRGAERAIGHGLDLAQSCGAAVYALSVIDVADLLGVDVFGDRADFEAAVEPLEEAASRAVEAVEEHARELGEHGDDVEVVTVVRQGSPYETILEYADEVDADLIVLGTHGRRGLSRALLGSTTERVVRTADVPVLAVRIDDAG